MGIFFFVPAPGVREGVGGNLALSAGAPVSLLVKAAPAGTAATQAKQSQQPKGFFGKVRGFFSSVFK